jgi:ribonuclease HII
MLQYEKKYKDKYRLIAGIDEAGRGPLAGPVVCACVIMQPDYINDEINDSKKLSAKVRERLYEEIIHNSVSYGVSVIDNKVIDEINILNATKKGMYECFNKLKIKPEILLVDAVRLDTDIVNEAIIGGDGLSFNIAAASIIAKVTRDKIMEDYDKIFPDYLFAKHKGYATKEHIELLKKCGATAIHRKTFIKNFFYEQYRIW